jgi:polyhydroxybutyrate depolymerase
MHGYSGTPEGIERFSQLSELANAEGVAVMYPEGSPTPVGGFGWSTGARLFATSATDDVEALREMIDAAVDTGCVDGKRVVISGESNGAGMALLAICDKRLQSRLAAAVLVIPAIDEAVLAHCDPRDAEPIGVSVVSGKLDHTVGYADGRPPFLGAEQWFQIVASAVNACPAQTPQRMEIDAFVERVVMSDCAACTEMFAIADGTHTWPGSSYGTGGQTPGTFALNRRLVALALDLDQGCLV